MRQEFLEPTLNGERFDDHTVPLEFLADFSALQEMLVEVAKWEFRSSHPDRERIPRNFSQGVDLHLTAVQDGSAKLVICLVFAGLFPSSSNLHYFEQAKTDIVEAIASAEHGSTPRLPPNLLTYFDRFGRGLRTGESITFDRPSGIATLTPETRGQLMRFAQAKEWTEEASLRVRIPEADKGRNSFEMELTNGTKLKGQLSELYQTTILDAFVNYNTGRDEHVLIQGILRKDRDNHLKGFDSIEHVTLLDPLDIPLRLEKLASLNDGWLDGRGRAAAREKLDWLADAFNSYFDADLPLPHLYPTPEGGIQAEWSVKDWEISLEINLDQQKGDYQSLNLLDNSGTECTFPLDSKEGWGQLNAALKDIQNQQTQEQNIGL